MAGSTGKAPETTPARPLTRRDWVTLSKPGITALIVLVAVAGYFVARPSQIAVVPLLGLVGFGALASAGAAMLNHYLDRDLDAVMHRTRRRPLPEARIRPDGSVAAVGLALSAIGVGGASWLVNPLTGVSILLGGLTYVVVYTAWLKRRSSWNIVIGGFAGSAPVLAGSAAATGTWTGGALALALLVFLWTPPHFWSLAVLWREDYARAGLPMLPKMDDVGYSGKVVVVSAALLVPAGLLVGWFAGTTAVVAVALVGLGVIFVLLTRHLWHDPARRWARQGFLYSGPYLLMIVAVVIANWFLPSGIGPVLGG